MNKPNWSAAQRHLKKDPVMRDMIAAVGPCTISPQRNHFLLLCRAIYSQQISSTVAAVLFGRFKEMFPRQRPTPPLVIELFSSSNEEKLRGSGLSRQKRKYLLDLAHHFNDGKIPTRRLQRMSDDQVIEALTAVHGIGRWTAEMFLMFTLNRPDVLPVDDLGLQIAIMRAYKLPHRPNKQQMIEIAEPWRPWRTVASWYLWRSGEAEDGSWGKKKK